MVKYCVLIAKQFVCWVYNIGGFLLKKIKNTFIDFREKGGGGRETLDAFPAHPDWGWNLPPRYVPWPEIEPLVFGCRGWCSNHATLGRTLRGSFRETCSLYGVKAGQEMDTKTLLAVLNQKNLSLCFFVILHFYSEVEIQFNV